MKAPLYFVVFEVFKLEKKKDVGNDFFRTQRFKQIPVDNNGLLLISVS